MSSLMQAALSEGMAQASLAVFTTTASGGVVACIILAVYVLAHPTDDERCLYLRRFLIIPLAAVILGLIASTNHLGRPSNTLYVLTGVGRSPLSNEVVAVAAFTGFTWIAWLLSFARQRFRKAVKALLVVSVLTGVLSLSRMAGAYSIDTIITWAIPYTQVNLILAGLASGPLLALVALRAAEAGSRRLAMALVAVGALMAVLLAVSESLQYLAFQDLQGGLYQAADLVRFYPACIVASITAMGAGIAVAAVPLIRSRPLGVPQCVAACLLSFAGVFIVRFAFYCMRLTAGF